MEAGLPETTNSRPASGRLWTPNFLLLWQGQLVSSVGDIFYEIALGFWVLAVTGSTALMGTLMAASTIPRVLLSPIAGVVVDRSDRKWLLVGMDAIRGVAVVLVGAAALAGLAEVWMVLVAGIIIGVCGAFFNPSISSVIPDIVHREKIVQANSFFSMIRGGSGILGNSIGGVLYAAIGAPLMFLVNGISYLFSGATELFVRVPATHKSRDRTKFMADLRDGFRFVWKSPGLRFLILSAAVMNFFAFIGIVLIVPHFQRAEWLGPARYGWTMAIFTAAMLLGTVTTAAVKIPARRRLFVFGAGIVLFVVPLAAMPFFRVFWPILVCMALGGYTNAIVNVLIQSVLQLSVPDRHRGKVFGLLDTLAGGLTPLGMAAGGILAEVLPLQWVMAGGFAMIGVFMFPQLGSKGLQAFFAVSESPEPAPADDAGGEA